MDAATEELLALSPRDLIARVRDLPSLPAIYFRVKAIIERADSSLLEIEREISYDAGITSRLLALANSAFYAVRGTLDSVAAALSLLGTEQIKHLLLVTSVATAFKGISPARMDMKKFWRTNAYRAIVARNLAAENRSFDRERCFVEALLGDIGHLVMYLGMPQATEKVSLQARLSEVPLYRVERAMLGFDYAEVGAELLAMWGLPPIIEAAVRHHPMPLAAGGTAAREASILYIATRFAEADFDTETVERWARKVDPIIWLEAGISADCLVAVKAAADEELDGLVRALQPDAH